MRQTLQLLILQLFIGFATTANGQEFKGKVVGNNDQPLKAVPVVLLDYQFHTIAFTQTKNDGWFAVSTPENKTAAWIMFNVAGYERDTLDVSNFINGQTIVLYKKSLEIKEVVVKSERINLHGDTLDYNVASFSQKQDRSIADVIKKMPGLDVKSDGTIEFEGKPINKFYVEGMDLMGSKYAQTSENLQADKVKKVQVMQNHQPIKALKDVSFSEQAALNIVLKDNAKSVWQGIVDVSAGHSLQGEGKTIGNARLMAMMFARKMQSVSIYKYNNSGLDVAREVNNIGSLMDYAPTESPVLTNISLPAPELLPRRSMFNNTNMLATNWLFKTSKDNDLRLQMNALFDKTNENQHRETSYTDLGSNATIVESNSAKAHRNRIEGELLYKVNTSHTYLSNSLKGFLGYDRSIGVSILNRQPTFEKVKPHQRYISDRLQFIRTSLKGNSLSGRAYVSYNYLPGSLLLTDGNVQQLDIETTFAGASTGWSQRLKRLTISYNLSENIAMQNYSLSNNQSQNKDKYKQYKTSMQTSLSYQDTYLRLNVSLPLTWLARQFNADNRSDVLVEPQVFAIYEPTSRWQFMAIYNYSWSPLDAKQMSEMPVYTSYINLQQGNGHFDNTMAHIVSGNIQYKRTAKGFMAQTGATYSNLRHTTLYNSSLIEGVYRRQATDLHSNSTNYSINGRLSKSFRWMNLTIALNGSRNWNNYSMIYGEEVAPFRMNSTQMGGRLSLQPAGWFSFEASSTYSRSQQINKKQPDLSADAIKSFNHELRLYFMPGFWQIEYKTDFCHSSDKSIGFNIFSDLTVTYRRKAYELGIGCYNIFGRSRYERQTITTSQHIYTINKLRPREIMVNVLFNI